MPPIPFSDLKPYYAELRAELDAVYRRVMESGWYILGPEVEAFEKQFAAYCGVAHCCGVANGLDALTLILKALEIGPGDEVLVPSNTYIATWLAVSQVGARPVPVEPDPDTFNIDPDRLVPAITSRTRAVIAVHLYGRTADMDPINAVADRFGLNVIEDAAQAQGAIYKGRRTGSLGHAAGFSFYPGKNLGAFGDAGAVTSNDAALIEKVRVLGNYGSRVKYFNQVKGVNSRLDPLQAALLTVKLERLDRWNRQRRDQARFYRERLQGVADFRLPPTDADGESVWHQFVVRHLQRDALQRFLSEQGIGTLIHYPVPPHLSEAYAPDGYPSGSLPLAETLAATVLSLPMGPHLGTADQKIVIDALCRF